MKINRNQPNTNIHFTNTMKMVVKSNGDVNRHYSVLFRDGQDFWRSTVERIARQYPKGDVKLTCYGSSDGSEPFTFIMSLFKWAKGFLRNFDKLNAFDVEPSIIRQAKSGICNIHDEDLDYMRRIILKGKSDEFFKEVDRTDSYFDTGIKMSDKIMDRINFRVADIFKHVDTLRANEKNVVFCRNLWNYLPKDKQGPLAEKLHDKTKNGGFIIIGDYDIRKGIPEILQRHNFKKNGLDWFTWFAK